MNVYFIYAEIPRYDYDERLKFLLSDQHDFRAKGNYMRGLYAITNNKKFLKEFFNLRGGNEMYTTIKRDLDEDDWDMIRNQYSDLILRKSHFGDRKNKKMELIVTKDEETTVQYDGRAYMIEFGPSIYANIDYRIFNDSIMNALDIIGYTSDYDINHSNDDERIENANFQESFLLTPLGHKRIDINTETNMLLYLYRVMFVGASKEGDD